MSELPLVSVVVPCLNRADYLVPTLQSILAQDYPRIECVVVDGGSSDETLQILKGFGGRIRWISEPDSGPAEAVNKGWAMSTGEIVTWLNADDLWVVPGAVRTAVDYLRRNPDTDIVYGECGSIDENGELIGMAYSRPWSLAYALEHADHCIPQPAAVIRRRLLGEIGILDPQFIIADRDLWFRAGLVGKIEQIPAMLAFARRHPSFWYPKSDRIASECVAISRRVFARADLSEPLRRLERRGLSNAYLRGADYASIGGKWWTGVRYCVRAILQDPSNVMPALRNLIGLLTAAAEDAQSSRGASALKYLAVTMTEAAHLRARLAGIGHERTPNLMGDRDVEWAWVASRLPQGPGRALDFGPGGSPLALAAALRGFEVTAVDLTNVKWLYRHPNLRFLQGDILRLPLLEESFDAVICCSTVEHVGLAGRYGVAESREEGDLEAMARLRRLLKPGGTLILTVPMGRDATFPPMCRVYGALRLPRLLDGFLIAEDAYWMKDSENRWVRADREAAQQFEAVAGSADALQTVYALGCFLLRKPD